MCVCENINISNVDNVCEVLLCVCVCDDDKCVYVAS